MIALALSLLLGTTAPPHHKAPNAWPDPSALTGGFVKPYCEGDGQANGGVDCPCGNELPPGTVSGCANRSGRGGVLTPSGTPSIANDTLVLTATGLPLGVPGFFFAGGGTGPASTFGNGSRCITGPIRLRKIVHSTGSDVYPVPGGPTISQDLSLTVGSLSFFQVLYRDNGGPCNGTTNATNAVLVLWGT